jgi:6,7-dimethyl-8-ribityllumazine synthase
MKKTKIRLGLVVSKFNDSITSRMEKTARARAKSRGAEITTVLYTPGCCDTPFYVQKMLKKGGIDAIAVLAVVLKGKTDHDQVVAYTAFTTIMQLSLKFDKPVTFGIIGPNATRNDAADRADEYAQRAVDAAVELARNEVTTIREHG